MPSIGKYRRVWFALLKAAGVPPDVRHGLQLNLTGKASTRNWTPKDWDRAISYMQRVAGDHNDRHAHVRAERPNDRALEDGEWATHEQALLIENLCDGIEWRAGRARGPRAFVLTVLLGKPQHAVRRKILDAEYATGERLWLKLSRAEANRLIRALEKMQKVYPVQDSVQV